MNDLLQLPIDRTCRLDAKSYKNPARIVMRSRDDRIGWRVYYCVHDGQHWYLDTIQQTAQGTAIVFAAGAGNELGVNQRLAELTGLSYRWIHDTASFFVFAVSPDGARRSPVHEFANDKYLAADGIAGPPWKLDSYGWPVKDKRHRGIFRRVMDLPPEYEPGDGPPPPPPPPPPDDDPTDPGEEPASLLETIEAERSKYGTLMTDSEMGELVNAVGHRHHGEGWWLAGKPTGAHALQPRTGIRISRDLLAHAPTQRMYDVLVNASTGEAVPTWNYAHQVDLPLVEPVEPEGAPPPPPPPDPDPEITSLSYPVEVGAHENFTIAWATERARRVELIADGFVADDAELPLSGSLTHRLSVTTSFVLRAYRDELVAEEGFAVRVRPALPPPPPPPPPPEPEPTPPPPPAPPRSWWETLRDLIRQLTGGSS